MKHLLRRVSAAALCALMLTGTAQAAVITPSAARVELAEDENTFTVDVSISEERAFAGMEFGVEVPDGVELTGVDKELGAVVLDSYTQEAWQGDTTLISGQVTGAFPMLRPGTNTMQVEGNVQSFSITPNWRSL